jgi:hypothetical protein
MNFEMADASVQQHIIEISDQVTQTRGCRAGRRARRDWFRRSARAA